MKSKVLILLLILIVLVRCGFSQAVFNKNYDIDYCYEAAGTVYPLSMSSGFILGGNYLNISSSFIGSLIIRVDCTGDTIWKSIYDISIGGGEVINKIIQINDGSFIVTGYAQDTINYMGNMFLMNINIYGDIKWIKFYGGSYSESSNDLIQTNDNGYIIAGYTDSYTNGGRDFYVVKTDSIGNIQWEKNYGGLNDETAYSIDYTYDNGYIIGGKSNSYGVGMYDMYIIKIDSAGNFIWDNTFGSNYDDYCGTVICTIDSGFALSGYIDVGSGNKNAYFVKTDSSGAFEFDAIYGYANNYEGFEKVLQLLDGSYLFLGGIWLDSYYKNQGWILKASASGDSLWSVLYGNIDSNAYANDYLYDLQKTSDNGFVLCGQYDSETQNNNAWIIKIDSLGCDQPICNNGCDSCAYINPKIYFLYDTVYLSSPTVQFVDTSDFAQSWFWDFGDSNTDTLQHPYHTYTSAGIYDIMLIAYYSDCADTTYKQVIVVNDVGISEINHEKIYARIYPNPTNGNITIESSQSLLAPLTFKLTDILGKVVFKTTFTSDGKSEITVQELSAGIYMYCILDASERVLLEDKLVISK
ncbi:MAG: T9SS type A sorting domain-containing protein [Bacteroidota bacterium]